MCTLCKYLLYKSDLLSRLGNDKDDLPEIKEKNH